MKNKFLLFVGVIIIIISIWSLILYKEMEERMPGFHAYDNYSWILLFAGIIMTSYFAVKIKKV